MKAKAKTANCRSLTARQNSDRASAVRRSPLGVSLPTAYSRQSTACRSSLRPPASGLQPAFLRRGSALMVALALLMLLAVFASLFLTSSRFDMDASTAGLDFVRMDLYAEGLAQYVQLCLVTDLWGFDDKPLNYAGRKPYGPTMPVVLQSPPDPDNP